MKCFSLTSLALFLAIAGACSKDNQGTETAAKSATDSEATPTTIPAMEVYQQFGKGLMSGTDKWKDYIAADITFVGPVDQVEGKDAFITLNETFFPSVRGSSLKQVVANENWVVTQLDLQVAMHSGKTITLEMSEWYEIKKGKIQSVTIYYDATEYRAEGGCIGSKPHTAGQH
ncbi:MAG: nuclear transport factor 2 family protein [Kofleriaceae bacterium]|nr:nuclear transport factor 2 family protein [Kofleriaceae bacterium]